MELFKNVTCYMLSVGAKGVRGGRKPILHMARKVAG